MTMLEDGGSTGAPPRNWWQRNWKWAVPTGCVTLVLLFALFVVGVVGFAFRAMKSADVVREAMAMAKANPEVRDALGEPIREGWYITGNIEVTGPSGRAGVAIPLKGAERGGTLYVVAEKSAGRWEYETLEVAVEGREERINLLEASLPHS